MSFMSFSRSGQVNDVDVDVDLADSSPPPNPELEEDARNTNRDCLTIRRRCELCKQRKV